MSSLPDFSKIDFDSAAGDSPSAVADWQAAAGERAERRWKTPEGIEVEPMYTAETSTILFFFDPRNSCRHGRLV